MKLSRFCCVFLPVLMVAVCGGVCCGSTPLPVTVLLDAFLGDGNERAMLILQYIRLPRVAAGVLAGIGLSLSGVLVQTVTMNELASPNIIGINSGAGLAIMVLLAFFPGAGSALSLAAFVGALAAALVILLVSTGHATSRTTILLVGIAITTLFNAIISFLSLLDEDILSEYHYFSLGSLKNVQFDDLIFPSFFILIALVIALCLSARLAALCLGDTLASALGIRVRWLRFFALSCAAISSAAVVSFAGLLGFVGLVVPHIARAIVGPKPLHLIVSSAILGATVVVIADLLGRTLFTPSELPVGILMSLIGAPYFLLLLCRRKIHAGIS